MREAEFFLDLWQTLQSVEDKKFARAIYHTAEQFDDFLLGYSVVPDAAVDFLIRFFSDERVAHSSGIEHFLLEMSCDFCKYTEVHQRKILNVLLANAGRFSDKLAKHSIGDFIARAYSPDVAFSTLLSLSHGSYGDKYVAFIGLDVLRMRADKTHPLYRNIIASWQYLLDTELNRRG